ncbi:MAG: hypothetical protein ABJE10_22980 [bacterium]
MREIDPRIGDFQTSADVNLHDGAPNLTHAGSDNGSTRPASESLIALFYRSLMIVDALTHRTESRSPKAGGH